MARLLKNAAKDIADAFTRWNLWQGGAGVALSDLNDVNISNPQVDEVLQFNGSEWINGILQGGGNLGGKVETLWTNLNPLNVFNSQNVSINTNYEIFFVHFRPSNTSNTNYCLVLNKVFNRTYYLYCNSGDTQDHQLMRSVTFNDGVIHFGDAFRPGIEFGNQYCIPTSVIGIKFAPIEEINASDVKIPIYGNVDAAIDSHDVQLAALDDKIKNIKTTVFSVTSNANGIAVLPLAQKQAIIVDIVLNTGSYFSHFRNLANGAWYITLENYNGTRVPNTTVSGTIYYIDR